MCMCEKRGLAVRSACGLTHRKADWGVHGTFLWRTCCLGRVRCDNCNTAPLRDTCHHDRSEGGHRAVAISLLCAFHFGLWATSNGGCYSLELCHGWHFRCPHIAKHVHLNTMANSDLVYLLLVLPPGHHWILKSNWKKRMALPSS